MAANASKTTVEDSIQVALDAADTAAGVTEEFNTISEADLSIDYHYICEFDSCRNHFFECWLFYVL